MPRPTKCKLRKMFRTAAECVMRVIPWLVWQYIPLRNLTVFHGAGESAKSLMALHIAAKVSRGQSLEFDTSGSTATEGDVLILAHEDTVEETIKPRLQLAGADMGRIHFRAPGMNIRLPEDTSALRWLIREKSIKLVVIDTLDDFSTRSTKNAQSVRAILNALGDLAEEQTVAIILICHWTKQRNNKGSLRNKMAGSFALLARGRCAYAFVPDPDEQGILMISTKGNIGGRKPTVLFDVDIQSVEIDGQSVEHPCILFREFSTVTEDDFEGTPSKVDTAIDYLEDRLRNDSVESSTIIADCPTSRQTLFMAKKILGVMDTRRGNGKAHRCYWQLPDDYFSKDGNQPAGGGPDVCPDEHSGDSDLLAEVNGEQFQVAVVSVAAKSSKRRRIRKGHAVNRTPCDSVASAMALDNEVCLEISNAADNVSGEVPDKSDADHSHEAITK
jgi:DNA repair protein RadA/Sms